MGYVSYRTASRTPRPLIFVWNGGPGANSATLHFEVAGPRRGEADRLVDNAETWLADADLVFVDPIGTGFSRPVSPEAGGEFYGTVGDVASVTEFVRSWILLHGAEDRPVLLAGESWGAGRAASVGYRLIRQGVPVHGLILISGGDGINTPYLSKDAATALRVADLAPVALFHRRLDPAVAGDVESARRNSEAWARDVYQPALARVGALSDVERTTIATTLARYTGIPIDLIDPTSLTFTPRQYLRGVLQDKGQTLNIFDMRLTENPPTHFEGAIDRYLRRDLNYVTDLPYVGLTDGEVGYAPHDRYPASVGARWNYATIDASPEQIEAAIREAIQRGGGPPRIGPPLPGTEEAIALAPGLKVLVAAGRYNSLASCTANDELHRLLPDPLRSAITYRCYTGGHMFYRDGPARLQFSRDIAEMSRTIR
ncbi:S10 family serine carboxypeptidase-like protein [Brevundimonas subvibrioides]|uniref:S10 family serine carboxypeptidase-like protein n=1 Tax=Brevundimonas subvibrioides TaxID=74313 RepID=UPI0032D56969